MKKFYKLNLEMNCINNNNNCKLILSITSICYNYSLRKDY